MESSDNNVKIMDETFYVLREFANFGEGTKLNCILYDDYIQFKAPGKNGPTAKLYYRHILELLYGSKTQLVQANKSVLARAIIGQALLGNKTGAMIGGMSAMQGGGKKTKQVTVYYLIIGYNGKDNKEKLILLQAKSYRVGKKYEDFIREKTGIHS